MLKLILSVAGGLLVLGLAIIGGLYAFDAPVGATVDDKRCTAGEIDVISDFFGARTTVQDVPVQQCGAVQKGNYVSYYVRSERVSIYESKGGACIYDSVHGPGGCSQ